MTQVIQKAVIAVFEKVLLPGPVDILLYLVEVQGNILKSVFDLPDISFIENDTLDAMMHRLVSNYEKRYKEVTGQTVSLGAADPARIPSIVTLTFARYSSPRL